MIPCGMLRMAVRASAVAACLASLAARPALACYCVEHCDSIQSEVSAPAEVEGQAPQANTYAVDFTWEPYPGAPEDCQYAFVGREEGGEEWVPLDDCTLQTNEAGDVTGAQCTVTAPSESGPCVEGPCGSDSEQSVDTWEYGVSGTSTS